MDAEWYYAEHGQQIGPVTFEELQGRAAAGLLSPTDLVWQPRWNDWRPASSQPGLFGTSAPSVPVPRREFDDRAIQNDHREYDRPRAAPTRGGGKILLFAAGGFLLLGLLCCGVLGVIILGNREPTTEHSWRLDTNQTRTWSFPFQQGDKVVITVTSVGNSDMDLFVFSDKNSMDMLLNAKDIDKVAKELCLRYDNLDNKDCRVEFLASKTQDYWVLLVNRKSMNQSRNGSNSGKLVFEVLPK